MLCNLTSARQEMNIGVVLKERPEHVPGIQADKVIDTAVPAGILLLALMTGRPSVGATSE